MPMPVPVPVQRGGKFCDSQELILICSNLVASMLQNKLLFI